ncbi:MAG: universal stress protein [Marinilabiliaceae bacterium]|nr:universal stress protein [Marinilabiliaceae bacterium]
MEEKIINSSTMPKVLLPIDFSEYSEKAGNVALDFAIQLNAELTIIHVYFCQSISTMPFQDAYIYDTGLDEIELDLDEQAELEMKSFVSKMQEKNALLGNKAVIKHHLLKGVPEDEILNFSKEYDPAMIIMGTRGKNRKLIDLIGSVTAEVMEKAKVPVMAIPEDFDYHEIDTICNILYVTNFEITDFVALKKLVSIVHPLKLKIFFVNLGLDKYKRWDLLQMDSLKNYVEKLVPNANVICDLIEADDFWTDLEKYIQNNHIDIISLTTHRRNLVSRLLYPSVGKKMLYQTTTPLLVFHA